MFTGVADYYLARYGVSKANTPAKLVQRTKGGTKVALAQLFVNAFVLLVIAGVGWYFANNYRLQTRMKLLELRVEAYRSLFELTEISSPTRRGRGECLSKAEAAELGSAIYGWYYMNGNGLLIPNSTRKLLQNLQQKLQGEPMRSTSPDPLLQEVSYLRSALRRDVGVFVSEEYGGAVPARARRWLQRPARHRHLSTSPGDGGS